MSARVILLAHLAAVLGHVFIIEQPGSARFGDLPCWRHFVENICYVSCFNSELVEAVGQAVMTEVIIICDEAIHVFLHALYIYIEYVYKYMYIYICIYIYTYHFYV